MPCGVCARRRLRLQGSCRSCEAACLWPGHSHSVSHAAMNTVRLAKHKTAHEDDHKAQEARQHSRLMAALNSSSFPEP